MKAVNPKNRILDTIANAIGPVVVGELDGPAQPKRAQSRVIKGRGTDDIRDTDACMVDHCGVLSF
jgi:hypothetical protein